MLEIDFEHQIRMRRESASYPPLQPVDDDVVGFVGDVERHQTQVGEIPEELWKEEENQVKINDKAATYSQIALLPSVTDVLVTQRRRDTPGPVR